MPTCTPIYRNAPLHADFVTTREQTHQLYYLHDRLEAAITAQDPDRPHLTSRARVLLRGLRRAAGTCDRRIVGQWLHEWEAAIEGELRTLGGVAPVQSAAA